MQVDAPPKIAPARPLALSGTATFTFGPNATATNASTAFTFLSDSFGVDVASGGQHRFLRIAELKTTRSTPDSSVVTAEWTLPDYLVPSTASGQLTVSLPHEAATTNPVSTTPESVAFTGELLTDSAVQPTRTAACALDATRTPRSERSRWRAAPEDDGSTAEPVAGADPRPGAAPPPAVTVPAPVRRPPVHRRAPPRPRRRGRRPGATAETALAAEAIPAATVPKGSGCRRGRCCSWVRSWPVACSSRWRPAAGCGCWPVGVVLALLVAPNPVTPSGRRRRRRTAASAAAAARPR